MSIQGTVKFAWDVLVVLILSAVYVAGLTVKTVVAHLARIPRTLRPAPRSGRGEPADRQ